ncbi:TadE/TadG family type IV pilus assembly protein [Kitasatospora sp. McL0602]|uniref:TadE/TadG family type IV pilus assembly protein n=1 Tax=Kitasatospora sp. McL0602 TaxID=3439530 RepID=UPI003F8878FE
MAISLAIVFPAVLAIVLLVVQVALWWYAGQVAMSAAREGADAGRVYDFSGNPAAARDAAAKRGAGFVQRFGGLAEWRGADAAVVGTTLHMSVTVRPLSLLPILSAPDITRHVDVPVERYVPQGGG